jgi:gamma-glutamylcyclotransferase (GGCT)/AIG2-like uncharacterized protein YtfP
LRSESEPPTTGRIRDTDTVHKREEPSNERLFVYGTLAPGQPNAHVLADVPGTCDEASVRGRLVQHGWGADMGYPALELSDEGNRVDGFVFTSQVLAEHWQRLDEFEGDAYERVVTQVRSNAGRHVRAHLYVALGHSSA